MNTLLISSDPAEQSFATSLAERYVAGVQFSSVTSVQRANLAREGFDPRISKSDLAFYRGKGPLPEDILREQERVEKADLLVLAFPIYWWSLPALLKGWVDRVFTKGWAFGAGGQESRKLADKSVRLIATGGADARAYEKHGYRTAITAQLEHGIFNFVGMQDVDAHLFLDVEHADPAARLRNLSSAYELGKAFRSVALQPA